MQMKNTQAKNKLEKVALVYKEKTGESKRKAMSRRNERIQQNMKSSRKNKYREYYQDNSLKKIRQHKIELIRHETKLPFEGTKEFTSKINFKKL